MIDSRSDLRVLVLQNGARHNYAVPSVLANSGALEAFYTDACGNLGLGRFASIGQHLPWIGDPMGRLASRRLPDAVRERTWPFAGAAMIDGLVQGCVGAPWRNPCIDYQLRSRGLKRANLVYSSLGWGRSLLREAKRREIPVVTEFYVRPSIWKTYQSEYRDFPSWEDKLPLQGLEDAVGSDRDPCVTTDYVIAPSAGVADEVVATHGFARERICVVPYGIGDSFFSINNRPIKGRILFAGTCCLGKGIHYLAFAANALAERGLNYDFRVAGNVSPRVRLQNASKHLHFLGRIPRSEFWREYETADLLVVPSLSESFSMVALEALAAGIPVVASHAASTVVRNDIDGFVIPERDHLAHRECGVTDC